MKFIEFKVQNFKGINKLSLKLEKSINANVYTLVGLNESGKTSILEAINLFNDKKSIIDFLEEVPGSVIKDYNTIIPVSKRYNFNDNVTISAVVKLDFADIISIKDYVKTSTKFEDIVLSDTMSFSKIFTFKDSKYDKSLASWNVTTVKKRISSRKIVSESIYLAENKDELVSIYNYCQNMIPSIIYFPNFLFDFPPKIYLEEVNKLNVKNVFYRELIQDILYSIDNSINIDSHLVNRIKSSDIYDRRNLSSLLNKMGEKITQVVFNAWHKIFSKTFEDTKIKIDANSDEDGHTYLEFTIEGQGGIYLLNERSLGFRWFFTFLLFTQFVKTSEGQNKNMLFLFDEPASNLHPNAQKEILKSFSKLIIDSKVIYTTHSHHMINPNWLESTYVVKNDGISIDTSNPDLKSVTNITVESYKEFAVAHPHNTAYFQPVLDVLEYVPSDLERIPECAFLEGKNDYYTLNYFRKVKFGGAIDVKMTPSTGSGNLDTLISLYMGWGKEFIVILDSDKEGKKQKDRYTNNFGLAVEESIFSLEDIDSTWSGFALEKLFKLDELLTFQKHFYPDSQKYSKKDFNRSMQEALIKEVDIPFSDETMDNFKKILLFIKDRFSVPFEEV